MFRRLVDFGAGFRAEIVGPVSNLSLNGLIGINFHAANRISWQLYSLPNEAFNLMMGSFWDINISFLDISLLITFISLANNCDFGELDEN